MAGNQPQKMNRGSRSGSPQQLGTKWAAADGHPRRSSFEALRPIEAVRGIDLDVGEGEIFGLIGPDGAGKTSTFQILAGVMEASGGVAEVLGSPGTAGALRKPATSLRRSASIRI